MFQLKGAVAALALALGTIPAAAQFEDIWRAGARVHAVASDHENLWAVGAIVSVRGTVRNEIRAAGAEVDVEAAAGDDIWAAGAIVSVAGQAAKNMHVAGARVAVNARVGGKLNVAGARIVIGPGTEVTGVTRVAGADIVFAGTGRGAAELYADTVLISGRIVGDVRIRARDVTLGNSAVIDGNVVFETLNEPTIAVGATVRGRQTVTMPMSYQFDRGSTLGAIVAAVLFGVGAGFVLGLLLLITARPFVERAIDSMRAAPVGSALVGLAVFILVPLVAALIMVTVVGIPIGLLILLAFPLMVTIGLVLAAFGLSDRLMNRRRAVRSFGGRVLLLVVGLLILAVIGLVPVLGFVVGVLALLIGLGALWRAARNRGPAEQMTLVSGER
jgi:cytoskeletal protein CcmA (bactofilin family)